MQDVIDTEFAQQTVLAVMHRLRFVRRFDKVIVLNAGRVAEFDSPGKLLEKKTSILAGIYRAGGFHTDLE